MSEKYVYCRVSTDQQEQARQLMIIREAGYKIPNKNIFTEKMTGTTDQRPILQKVLAKLKKGDTIIVESISRLGRSVVVIVQTVEKIEKTGAKLVIIKEQIDTSTAMGRCMFNIFATFAQLERDNISQRTKEALRAKKEAGVVLGRPIGSNSKEPLIMQFMIENMKNDFTQKQIAEKLEISEARVSQIKKKIINSGYIYTSEIGFLKG